MKSSMKLFFVILEMERKRERQIFQSFQLFQSFHQVYLQGESIHIKRVFIFYHNDMSQQNFTISEMLGSRALGQKCLHKTKESLSWKWSHFSWGVTFLGHCQMRCPYFTVQRKVAKCCSKLLLLLRCFAPLGKVCVYCKFMVVVVDNTCGLE